MHVINFGTPLQSGGQVKVRPGNFFGPNTLLDADMIFWNIQSTYSNMAGNPTRINVISPKEKETYEKGIILRKKEFEEFFHIGRTLVITAPIFHEYKYQIKEGSGNGTLDIWKCLPIDPPKCSINNGQNIETIDEWFTTNFLDIFKHNLYYNYRIDQSNGIPLFFIKDTKYVVGEYYKVGNGIILIMPEFNLPQGKDIEEFVLSQIHISNGLLELESENEFKYPEMVYDYKTPNELSERKKLDQLIQQKVEIEKKIEAENEVIDEINKTKLLFTSDGDLLETTCKAIFERLGFETIKPEKNRDDLIIKFNEYVAVVEIKGTSKSSGEKHSAQLQKWVSDYHINKDYNPKGILIVNTYKNIPIENRTEKDFPDQMMKYVSQMEHCLISGLQLFALYEDFKGGKISQEKVLELLFNTVGELKYTKNIERYLIKNEVQSSR
ncbi:MAG: hypothetical protein RIC35_01695 [Marinoscillum sp.]